MVFEMVTNILIFRNDSENSVDDFQENQNRILWIRFHSLKIINRLYNTIHNFILTFFSKFFCCYSSIELQAHGRCSHCRQPCNHTVYSVKYSVLIGNDLCTFSCITIVHNGEHEWYIGTYISAL